MSQKLFKKSLLVQISVCCWPRIVVKIDPKRSCFTFGPPLPARNTSKVASGLLLGCSWAASWQLLGPAWPPFRLHLEPPARLLGSTWGPWGAFGRHLGASWAPLGLHLGPLGASWANLGPCGRQMASKCTPTGRQMYAKWTPSWTATTAANFNALLKNAATAAKSHRTPCQQYFLSPDGDTMQH